MSRLGRRRTMVAYLFMAPGLLVALLYIYWPMMAGAALSLFDYSVLEPPRWVGLQNYIEALHDPRMWNALKNSLLYLLVVPAIQLASILLALLVNQQLRGVQFFRTLYFLPVITPMVVAALMWQWVFQSDGILNYLLSAVGLTKRPILFLGDPRLALYSVMSVTFWTGFGYYMTIYLAGLQGIPGDLYEAAEIDGAGPWARFTRITLPLMMPYVLFCSIMSCFGALSVFTEVFAMTGGGPAQASETMGIYTYLSAFYSFRFGYAAALSVILSFFILLVTLINLRVNRSGLEGYQL
ncbi:MAG TPA: sugar ABC transporter permease [Limnochorda sp.]